MDLVRAVLSGEDDSVMEACTQCVAVLHALAPSEADAVTATAFLTQCAQDGSFDRRGERVPATARDVLMGVVEGLVVHTTGGGGDSGGVVQPHSLRVARLCLECVWHCLQRVPKPSRWTGSLLAKLVSEDVVLLTDTAGEEVDAEGGSEDGWAQPAQRPTAVSLHKAFTLRDGAVQYVPLGVGDNVAPASRGSCAHDTGATSTSTGVLTDVGPHQLHAVFCNDFLPIWLQIIECLTQDALPDQNTSANNGVSDVLGLALCVADMATSSQPFAVSDAVQTLLTDDEAARNRQRPGGARAPQGPTQGPLRGNQKVLADAGAFYGSAPPSDANAAAVSGHIARLMRATLLLAEADASLAAGQRPATSLDATSTARAVQWLLGYAARRHAWERATGQRTGKESTGGKSTSGKLRLAASADPNEFSTSDEDIVETSADDTKIPIPFCHLPLRGIGAVLAALALSPPRPPLAEQSGNPPPVIPSAIRPLYLLERMLPSAAAMMESPALNAKLQALVWTRAVLARLPKYSTDILGEALMEDVKKRAANDDGEGGQHAPAAAASEPAQCSTEMFETYFVFAQALLNVMATAPCELHRAVAHIVLRQLLTAFVERIRHRLLTYLVQLCPYGSVTSLLLLSLKQELEAEHTLYAAALAQQPNDGGQAAAAFRSHFLSTATVDFVLGVLGKFSRRLDEYGEASVVCLNILRLAVVWDQAGGWAPGKAGGQDGAATPRQRVAASLDVLQGLVTACQQHGAGSEGGAVVVPRPAQPLSPLLLFSLEDSAAAVMRLVQP